MEKNSEPHAVVCRCVALALSSVVCFRDKIEMVLLEELKELILGTVFLSFFLFFKGNEECKLYVHVFQLYSLLHPNL